jgi:hypothetical protein
MRKQRPKEVATLRYVPNVLHSKVGRTLPPSQCYGETRRVSRYLYREAFATDEFGGEAED